MADNVAITAGTGTTIAADDVGGVKFQRIKIACGADGTANDNTATDPVFTSSVSGTTTASANFTRPADTNIYAVGDLIANNTTAASVTPLSFTVARANDKGFRIVRVRLKKTTTTLTNASFRLHLYRNDPSASTGITNGDNGVWLTKEAEYLGAMDVTMDKAFSDLAKGIGNSNTGPYISGVPTSGAQTVFGLLEARSTYTPGSAEVFTAVLEVDQD